MNIIDTFYNKQGDPIQVVEIRKSTRDGKKYMAYVIFNGKRRLYHFGALGYQQYKDQTPLKLYSDLDHNNKQRRELYLKRHVHDNGVSGILSREYLW